MEQISQEQVKEITSQIQVTEAWIKFYMVPDIGRELIEAALSDLKTIVASGEVPD